MITGLVAFDRQIEEIGGFLNGVGAVGDDDAVDVRTEPAAD